MRIKDYKCKCGHNDFFFADKGNQKGIYCLYCGKWVKWADKDEQNLTLKQDSCGDAVSRQAVKEQMIKYGFHAPDMTVTEFVEDLQPVIPQLKIGKWLFVDEAFEHVRCSNCAYGVIDLMDGNPHNYCPNCGCYMGES